MPLSSGGDHCTNHEDRANVIVRPRGGGGMSSSSSSSSSSSAEPVGRSTRQDVEGAQPARHAAVNDDDVAGQLAAKMERFTRSIAATQKSIENKDHRIQKHKQERQELDDRLALAAGAASESTGADLRELVAKRESELETLTREAHAKELGSSERRRRLEDCQRRTLEGAAQDEREEAEVEQIQRDCDGVRRAIRKCQKNIHILQGKELRNAARFATTEARLAALQEEAEVGSRREQEIAQKVGDGEAQRQHQEDDEALLLDLNTIANVMDQCMELVHAAADIVLEENEGNEDAESAARAAAASQPGGAGANQAGGGDSTMEPCCGAEPDGFENSKQPDGFENSKQLECWMG